MSWLVKFIKKNSDRKEKSFQEIYNDLGIFEYTEDGFKVTNEESLLDIKWNDILQINVFKEDHLTTDCIMMEIIHSKGTLSINEEVIGWYQFVLKSKEVFPSISKTWDFDIINPAFERNFRVIYQKVLI